MYNNRGPKKGQKGNSLMPLGPKGVKALTITGVIVGGLAVGFGGGFLIGHFAKPKVPDFDNVDINAAEDDNSGLLARYVACKESGKDPTQEFTIPELANISLQKFESYEHSSTFGYGEVQSAVNLDVRDHFVRNGSEFFQESTSKSAQGAIVNVIVAQRDYQHGLEEGSDVDTYVGTINGYDAENPNWSSPTKTTRTTEEYEDTFGKKVSRTSVYIISSKSVLEDGSSVVRTADGYTITMNLDTVKGVARYRKRMIGLSNSEIKSFEYVKLTYNVDNDFNLITSRVNEKYAAGMGGVSATCVGEMRTYYYTGTIVEIPDMNTNTVYPKEGGSNNA